MRIQGSKIMVTGASGGLGQAIARDLAQRGATLIVTARRRAQLEALAADTGAEVVVADLSDPDDVLRLEAMQADLDVLIANAGVGQDPRITKLSDDDIDFAIDVNLRAPMKLATAFAQSHLSDDREGQIVLIGSLAGLAASPESRLYNATKFGLRGFALSLRQDLDDQRIGVSLVLPGFIRDAGMFADGDINLPKGVRTKAPADVAAGVVRAIQSNPAEVFVSPVELRMTSLVATVAPTLSARIQKMLGAADRAAVD